MLNEKTKSVMNKYLEFVKDAFSNLYRDPFTAFNEQLAILQRTATTAQ
jgi:hypothetical protein